MPGGLIQLTAYGAQDFYLTGNPQISFFKAVYRRYTNFSMEMIEILPNVNVDLQENADSSKLSFKISRNGDLVKDMYLVFTLPSIFSSATKSFEWIKRIGEYIIKEVTITVGGKELDKQHGEYMHFYNELYLDELLPLSEYKLKYNTQSFWFRGGKNPENNCHSVIDRPESVSLVKPPTTIIIEMIINIVINHKDN